MRYLFFIADTVVPTTDLPTDADAIEYAKRFSEVHKIANAENGTTIWRKPAPPSKAKEKFARKGRYEPTHL